LDSEVGTQINSYEGYPAHLITGDDLDKLRIKWVSRDLLVDENIADNIPVIINLDSSNGPGTHWTAFMLHFPYCFYYDPVSTDLSGFPPEELRQYCIERNFTTIYCNDIVHMPPLSNLCGYFCIWFCRNINGIKNEEEYDRLLASFGENDDSDKIRYLKKQVPDMVKKFLN